MTRKRRSFTADYKHQGARGYSSKNRHETDTGETVMALSRYQLKEAVETLPEPVGRRLAWVPFSLRLGPEYPRFVRAIRRAERIPYEQAASDTLRRLIDIYEFAIREVPFYREFFGDQGFTSGSVRSFSDWEHLPVVTKEDLQGVPLSRRCADSVKGMKINTGGTSGQPLEFYLDRQVFAREWAHMHWIWRGRGYRPGHLKLTFRGKHFERARPLQYNAVHNEYVVNASAPMSEVVDAVLRLPQATTIRWLHGYPSLIAEFAQTLETQASATALSGFRARLYGALLGSEYPAPIYRSTIENVLTANVVAWYGHSEMAMLARESAREVYQSMPTYGYAEAVPTEDGGHRLVSTGFHNRAHPFIRYDTGDRIEPLGVQGGSLTFRVAEGRVGDFIVDRRGQRHALTALIFGRHAPGLGLLRHLQVRQDAPGQMTLLLTPLDTSIQKEVLFRALELDDLEIDWRVELLDEPIRTPAGKIRLKVE